MLHVSFNQDYTCFAYSTENGFAVYNCDPPTERFSRLTTDNSNDGIGIIEMLFCSNIFALVGGGEKSRYPPNKVIIWDDHQTKCVAEFEFRTPVTGVRLRRDIILVTLADCTYIYKFKTLRLVESRATYNNPTGIAAVTSGTDNVYAILGEESGQVYIKNFETGVVKTIQAHTSPIACMALSTEGDQLATASERGTLIRIYDTVRGELLREFRRGTTVATITSLLFDLEGERLAVCSNKGTLHIFSLITGVENRHSSLMYISNYLPQYFSSEWSAISFQVPPNGICAFGVGTSVIVVTKDGMFCKYEYDTVNSTGKCTECVKIY